MCIIVEFECLYDMIFKNFGSGLFLQCITVYIYFHINSFSFLIEKLQI